MGSLATLMLWLGFKGEYFLFIPGLFCLFLMFWGVLFVRPPGVTLKESCVVLSLYFFKKEIPYGSIRSISVSKPKRPVGRTKKKYYSSSFIISPVWFYCMVIIASVSCFILFYFRETFSKAIKLGLKLFVVLIVIAVIYHIIMYLISLMTSRLLMAETNLNIDIDPKALEGLPFAHYNKYPIEFRLSLPFLDITKSQYVKFLSNIETKINPKVLHPTAIDFKMKSFSSKDGG